MPNVQRVFIDSFTDLERNIVASWQPIATVVWTLRRWKILRLMRYGQMACASNVDRQQPRDRHSGDLRMHDKEFFAATIAWYRLHIPRWPGLAPPQTPRWVSLLFRRSYYGRDRLDRIAGDIAEPRLNTSRLEKTQYQHS